MKKQKYTPPPTREHDFNRGMDPNYNPAERIKEVLANQQPKVSPIARELLKEFKPFGS